MIPELFDLLIGLAGTDPATLYDDDSGMGNGHVSALVESWQAAGFPGIEQGALIPDGFDDLCMIEVAPPHRGSRGRFWMPKGHGYTNDPKQAGLFTADEARDRSRRQQDPRGSAGDRMIPTTHPVVRAMAEEMAREASAIRGWTEDGRSFWEDLSSGGTHHVIDHHARLLTDPATRDAWVRWLEDHPYPALIGPQERMSSREMDHAAAERAHALRDNPSALTAAVCAALETM